MGIVTASPSVPGGPSGARSDRSTVGGRRDPQRPFAPSSFTRLARTHAASVGGDALFAIALAGSVFFSLDFNDARWKVALYLVLTIAPFAVAAPLIGPVLDRIKGGRRWVVVVSMAARAVLAYFVIRHLDAFWFYPEAFLMLVFGKVYSISKSALVPTTVRSDDELVEANSKLAVLSAIAVVVVAPFGGAFLKLGGPGWVLGLAMILFAVGTFLALQVPPATVATQPEGEAEREELRGAGIILAVSAMGLVRAIVGFLTFMLAFSFKSNDAPLWQLGVAAAAAQLGYFGGAVLAPRLRQRASEESMVAGCLTAVLIGGLVCALVSGLVGAAILSLVVGAASSAAKQAFDSIVQRDAPDANRGRSFARFETRFQLFWVFGALIPIVITIPAPVGYLVIAVVAAFAAGSYMVGQSRVRKGHLPTPRRLPRPPWPRGRGAAAAGDEPSDLPPPPASPPPPPPPPGSRRGSADPTRPVASEAGAGHAPRGPSRTDPTVASSRAPAPPSTGRRLFDAPADDEPPVDDHRAADDRTVADRRQAGSDDLSARPWARPSPGTGVPPVPDYPEPPWRDRSDP